MVQQSSCKDTSPVEADRFFKVPFYGRKPWFQHVYNIQKEGMNYWKGPDLHELSLEPETYISQDMKAAAIYMVVK